MLSTAADLVRFPPSQVNQGGLKDFIEVRAKSQLADVSHTPNEQMGLGPRHTPSRVRLDSDDPFPLARREGELNFPRYGDANPGARVVHLVYKGEDVPWTETQLSAIVCSTGEDTTIIEEEHGVELSACDVNDMGASQDLAVSTHRRHSSRGLDHLSVSALANVDTGLAARVQAPTPDIPNGIDREGVHTPSCDANHTPRVGKVDPDRRSDDV